jgi:hypothetical protein
LEKIVCVYPDRSARCNNLAVLTSRLESVSDLWNLPSELDIMYQALTNTVPDPKDPDQKPPAKETQFLLPKGVSPTEIRGLTDTDMRKSCVSIGGGRESAA